MRSCATLALLDLVVMDFLFRKYPAATSGQLSWARSRAVCAPALATIAVKRLSLQKYLLANSSELGIAIEKAVPVHSRISYEDIVLEGWKYDPPKALSDIVESICGAILVDSGYDYERTAGIVKRVMEPILEVLKPVLPRDPTSELMLSLARRGCQQARFEYVFVVPPFQLVDPVALCRKFASGSDKAAPSDSIRFKVHGITVGSPVRSKGGLSRAKPVLAQMVNKLLEDPISEFYLECLCDCKTTKGEHKTRVTTIPDDVIREELDDEKEEEFAVLGILELRDADGVLEPMTNDEDDIGESEDELEEEDSESEVGAVERMLVE